MTSDKQWQEFALIFKELLQLETEPVGISCLKDAKVEQSAEKARICRSFLKASAGETITIGKDNNACFGAAWHLGFHQLPKDSQVMKMVRKFVVEGEKLFCSYQALDTMMSAIEDVPDNTQAQFLLSPLEKCEQKPELVMFVCNAEQACRLLTLSTFLDGVMPKIKIGGPTCRLAVIYPLTTGEVNISFYDYTARKMCNVQQDKLLVTIPYQRIPQIIESIDKCSAGRAKIEFPQEFREFLQKRMATRATAGQ
ncbi:DUF169 domain-containing protein, partial [Candidatus Omnitrophota bacterium]